MKAKVAKGFTLIEMLVVMGIIAIVIGASINGYARMTRSAEKAKAQELVSNVATALTAMFQEEGVWPKRLAMEGKKAGRLTADVCLPLAKGRYFSLTLNSDSTALSGNDKFGIVTPWAASVIKRLGSGCDNRSVVSGKSTIDDHVLYFALDLDGDGIIEGAQVGDETIDVRATAIVWSIGKSGGNGGKPWSYQEGLRRDDVYSWSFGQTQNVK